MREEIDRLALAHCAFVFVVVIIATFLVSFHNRAYLIQNKGTNLSCFKLWEEHPRSVIKRMSGAIARQRRNEDMMWLDAFSDTQATIYTFPSCVATADLAGDGDYRLIIADLGIGNVPNKLRVINREFAFIFLLEIAFSMMALVVVCTSNRFTRGRVFKRR